MKSKSILDPTFVYVKAADTDIRKTFERIRAEQRKQEAEKFEQAQVENLRDLPKFHEAAVTK